jgi:ferredoxin/flavodoxin
MSAVLKTEVYYFSGTGNSLVIARSLAEKLNAKLTPVMPLLKMDSIETNAEAIGLVFPIYGQKPARIINSFVEKLPNLDSKYVFAVATYGLMAQGALKKLDSALRLHGGKLSAGVVVRMPLNGSVSEKVTVEQLRKMEQKAQMKIEALCSLVGARQAGKIETTNIWQLLFSRAFVKILPSFFSLMGYVIVHGSESNFNADERCIGCGTCVSVCPMDNISLVDKKPSWGKTCVHCSACLNWCPQHAVQAGTYTINKTRYHHPDLQAADIIKQKQTN